jgi:TolB-like protein/tetratricopeptide (TPR) repeat protein
LSAILAADVAGYSRLMGADEEGTLAQLRAHRAGLVEPKIAENRGRLVKTTGDGMLAEFGSSVDAVRCAVDIQLAMASANLSIAASKRVEFRIGVHVGDIISEDDDIFGDGVNIAARLEGLADAGGICVSSRVQEDVYGRIDVTFRDGGEQQLKNIARPIRIYRIQFGRTEAPAAPAPMLALPGKPSVAVLPFQNMSTDADQDYFADGMVDDITMALSRFRHLFVISRNSSFTYKGRAVSAKQIGRELGVRYVLEGSVRKSGQRVRISGQLVDAITGTHLWVDRFEGTLEDVFDLQDKVTTSVVSALAPTIRRAEIERARHRPTESSDAHLTHMRGVGNFYQWTKAGMEEALRLFYEAMKIDPDFSLPYGMAANCYVALRSTGWVADFAPFVPKVVELVAQAPEVGRDDAFTLGSTGFAAANILNDLDAGAALLDRALALNANFAQVWVQSAYVRAWLGEPELALAHTERARRLSPVDPQTFTIDGAAALAHFLAGRNEEALSVAEMALRQNPFFSPATRIALASAALLNRTELAKKYLAQLRMLDPTLSMSNLAGRIGVRRPEHIARFTEGLRKAGLPE